MKKPSMVGSQHMGGECVKVKLVKNAKSSWDKALKFWVRTADLVSKAMGAITTANKWHI